MRGATKHDRTFNSRIQAGWPGWGWVVSSSEEDILDQAKSTPKRPAAFQPKDVKSSNEKHRGVDIAPASFPSSTDNFCELPPQSMTTISVIACRLLFFSLY